MATLYGVLAAIEGVVTTALAGLQVDNAACPVAVGIGWPPIKTLQANVKAQGAVVAIYDLKRSRNTTRWNPYGFNDVVVATQLVSTLSTATVQAGASATITLSGTLQANDAVSLVAWNNYAISPAGSQVAAQVAIATAGDTLTTLAAKLAAQIGADPTLPSWVSVSSSGPVVTLTSLAVIGTTDAYASGPDQPLYADNGAGGAGATLLWDTAQGPDGCLRLMSATGNQGTRSVEIGRRERDVQVVLWAKNDDIRNAVGNALETVFSNIEAMWDYQYQAGLVFPDGSTGRLMVTNDYDVDDSTFADTLRRDFHLSVEYPVTTTDQIYTILAPVVTVQPGYA